MRAGFMYPDAAACEGSPCIALASAVRTFIDALQSSISNLQRYSPSTRPTNPCGL